MVVGVWEVKCLSSCGLFGVLVIENKGDVVCMG